MNQRDINDLLNGKKLYHEGPLPRCPRCGYKYLGDGKNLCLECEEDLKQKKEVGK